MEFFYSIVEKATAVLIRYLAKHERRRPKVTYKLFLALQLMERIAAVELIFINEQGEVLLTYRNDEHFKCTWAFPGGWVTYEDETPFDACIRIAARELRGVLITPGPIFVPFRVYFWKKGEHPYGKAISIYVQCAVDKGFENLRQYGTFFDPTNLPTNTEPRHSAFIEEVLSSN